MADLSRVVTLNAKGSKLALLVERGVFVQQAMAADFQADPQPHRPYFAGTSASMVTLLNPDELVQHVYSLIAPRSP
jgi:hypothetical protein